MKKMHEGGVISWECPFCGKRKKLSVQAWGYLHHCECGEESWVRGKFNNSDFSQEENFSIAPCGNLKQKIKFYRIKYYVAVPLAGLAIMLLAYVSLMIIPLDRFCRKNGSEVFHDRRCWMVRRIKSFRTADAIEVITQNNLEYGEIVTARPCKICRPGKETPPMKAWLHLWK